MVRTGKPLGLGLGDCSQTLGFLQATLCAQRWSRGQRVLGLLEGSAISFIHLSCYVPGFTLVLEICMMMHETDTGTPHPELTVQWG